MELKEEIRGFFQGDVDDSPKTLAECSRDASLFRVQPALVVYPKNVEDIKKLVAFVDRAHGQGRTLSLTVRAAGTDMTGGPLTESIVVEMTRYFNHTKTIGADFAIVEPGVFYRDFEKETLRHGLLLPSYPASRELCTVGGMVANNSGGEKTLRYGKTERYVRALKMILRDGNEYSFQKLTAAELKEKTTQPTLEGELYRGLSTLIEQHQAELKSAKPAVTKNSSGYFLWNVYDPTDGTFDVTRLITGSQGTFGIITEITFELVKPDPVSRLLVVFLDSLNPLARLTQHVQLHHPESFESYDDQTFRLAFRFFPQIIARIGSSLLRVASSLLPEAWMLLKGGIPKLVLLIEFTGTNAAEAEQKAMAARSDLRAAFKLPMRVTKNDTETRAFQVIRRESFNLLRKHIHKLRTAPFIDDFAVDPKYLPEFLGKLYAILGKYKLLYTIAGHVGDGNFHIIPLMDLQKPGTTDVIWKLSREVYALVLSYKGTITAEHNDGIIRSPFLPEEFGSTIYRLFEDTKKIFDPNDIFNPGKKVGASFTYAEEHLDRAAPEG